MENLGKFLDMPMPEYRKADGLANSDALLIQRTPSDYVWSKNAPVNLAKAQAADFGSALHCAILEPQNFERDVFVSSVKGRTTQAFNKDQTDNPDKIVITELEAEQIRITADSVKAHPTANMILNSDGDCEVSVFARCTETGVLLKCRPDKDTVQSLGGATDVKTTALIDDWRSDVKWKNPLFVYNYGHTAAFYMHALSCHYGFEVTQYHFLAVQKSVEFGRYPVAVFTVTKDDLIAWGFWDQMMSNIRKFKECNDSGNWIHAENFNFASFEDFNDDVEVVFEGNENA